MAFPSNIGTKPDTLDTAWKRARETAGTIKLGVQTLRTAAASSGGCSARLIVNGANVLATYRATLQNFVGFTNLQGYARAQVNDATLDLAAEFTAMTGAMDDVTAWIKTNFPQDGSGFLLEYKFAADGTTVDRVLTQAQCAPLVSLLDTLIAAIN